MAKNSLVMNGAPTPQFIATDSQLKEHVHAILQ